MGVDEVEEAVSTLSSLRPGKSSFGEGDSQSTTDFTPGKFTHRYGFWKFTHLEKVALVRVTAKVQLIDDQG